MKPYLIVSDLHCHAWSQFATTTFSGINSRLQVILDELVRAANELLARGGDTMIVAGDVFHVRGAIDPEVFNPVHQTFKGILASGVKIIAIPGNHDLKGKDTTEIGNAFQSLGSLEGFKVVTDWVAMSLECGNIVFVPWQATKAQLREKIRTIIEELPGNAANAAQCDLIMHVGIDGMLDGVPASGLSAAEVASWGFKRVFAGDYHNHRVAEGGKVISIGATTHQTWSDIGSKAGFLLVTDDEVKFHASHAPSFIEITGEDDPDDIPLMVDGNYVRVREMKLTDAEIKLFRENLEEMGARGVTFQVAREIVGARTGSAAVKAETLDESVGKFVDTMSFDDPAMFPLVKALVVDVLNTVRSVSA